MSVLTLNKNSNSRHLPRVLAITGGKGGVGKTSLSVNLSIALSRNGAKVCLFDADTGLANVNIMLGLHPAYTLEHLFTGEKSIQDIVLKGPEGVQIIPGASGFAQCVELDVGQQQRLVSSLQSIEPHYDYMVVDTAAGISPTVLHFIAASQVAAIVVTPEPTSLTDSFSLVKVLKRRGYRRKVQVIVNMCANSSQAEKVYRRFDHAVKKYLQLETEYLGSVWMDESMRTAVTLQRPVALFPKHDPSARSFYRLAERIDDVFSRPGVPKLAFSAYWQKLLEAHASRKQKEFENNGRFAAQEKEVAREEAELARGVGREEARAQISGSSHRGLETSSQTGAPESLASAEPKEVSENTSEGRQPVTQVERQLEQYHQGEKLQSDKEGELSAPNADQVLSEDAENNWLAMRLKLNQFVSDSNTTPEQVTTLMSSLIFGFGDRLGPAVLDLLHGMLATLEPEMLDEESRVMLKSQYLRLGLEGVKADIQDESIEVEENKERYDAQGFGCQKNLAQVIRGTSDTVPLENLLESIKYAALVDNSKD